MNYYPGTVTHILNEIKVVYNYAIKKELDHATGVDTSELAPKKDWIALKAEDIIILYLCTKNLDDTIYSSWGIECDRLKLIIIGHVYPFTPSP